MLVGNYFERHENIRFIELSRGRQKPLRTNYWHFNYWQAEVAFSLCISYTNDFLWYLSEKLFHYSYGIHWPAHLTSHQPTTPYPVTSTASCTAGRERATFPQGGCASLSDSRPFSIQSWLVVTLTILCSHWMWLCCKPADLCILARQAENPLQSFSSYPLT